MGKYNISKVERKSRRFCYEFIDEINRLVSNLAIFNVDIKSLIPSILLDPNISFNCILSEDRGHVLIIFARNNKDRFNFHISQGDVFNYLDETGTWTDSYPVAFHIQDSINININGCKIVGAKPFEIVGKSIELFINNLELDLPHKGAFNLEYAIVMSFSVLQERLKDIKQFADNFVRVFSEYYKTYGESKGFNKQDNCKLIEYYNNIRLKMEDYFFDQNTPEAVIDKFLEENPLILEQCLNLINVRSQLELDVLVNKERYNGKDLKPDLIAYDNFNRRWAIVDYKRAKRTIIKNLNQSRSGFKSEVLDLQYQLRDYLEYFDEEVHRNHINNKYNLIIEYPTAIGVIGNVGKDEERQFNRSRLDLPSWLAVIPYNYMYNKFCDFISMADKLN
jgi:hypothetical protein